MQIRNCVDCILPCAAAVIYMDNIGSFVRNSEQGQRSTTLMYPTYRFGYILKLEYRKQICRLTLASDLCPLNTNRTECNDIKDLDRLVQSRSGKASPILTDTHALDLANVGSELFHRFYPHSNFLPELDHTIHRTRDQEISERRNSDK